MTAQLLAGGPVADAVLADVTKRVEALANRGKVVGLGTILVGDDAASAGYVRKKHETSEQVGVVSHHIEIAMHPTKDGDGLHPVNLGKLVLQEEGPVPATPAGIREMFVHYGIDIAGKHVVVCGRGPTLGRPLALLLTLKQPGANAAVTVVHSGVPDLTDYTRQADIVIAAVGVPSFVTPDMVRPGAAVVSGGISWEGRRLLPDVDESVAEVASWITPRLGGVGPTTVAMLLRNTVEAAERTLAAAT
jgi:methylenetetrahydrofolate dehydrogenase (NADP+) / methenyltetrahydrofolate cyclohydrolase